MKTYTVKDVQEITGFGPEKIRRALRSGELKAAKPGGQYRISEHDLNEWYIRNGGGSLFGNDARETEPRGRTGASGSAGPVRRVQAFIARRALVLEPGKSFNAFGTLPIPGVEGGTLFIDLFATDGDESFIIMDGVKYILPDISRGPGSGK
ncbi:helix-turn-helix domain-containing protein [bacterium]|nr:helix-turn-helix domain-containing protein [candidate division CSSED10-310 bacterium]